MRRILLIAALVAAGGCARENPAFNAGGASDGGNVSGEDTTDGGDTSASTTAGPTPPPDATGATSSPGVTTDEVPGTSVGRYDVPRFLCEAGGICDAFTGECGGASTCRPHADGDELVSTRCMPDGDVPWGGPCVPACGGGPDETCGNGLLCARTGKAEGECHFLCKGTFEEPLCDPGICFRELTETGMPYGVCAGECDPFEGESCGGAQCVIGLEDPFPTCVPGPDNLPVEGCEDDTCPQGWGCIPHLLTNDCSAGSCCMRLCQPFPGGAECDEGTCTPFEEIGGPSIPIGFCNPG